MRALRAQPIARAATAVLAVLVAFALLGELVALFFPAPQGPASSSYATSSAGLAAYATLLGDEGHPATRLRDTLDRTTLDPRATLFVLDAGSLLTGEGRALRSFLLAGGRLVLGGSGSDATVPVVLGAQAPQWQASGASDTVRLASTATTAGVQRIRSAGDGSWVATSVAATPLVGVRGGPALLLSEPYGHGTLLLLADVSPLQNRLLDQADNAQLGLNLAGATGRPVAFDEAVHGYGAATGLAALPTRWRVALALLALALATWALARGRRLGPAVAAPPPPPPQRAEYLDAMALVLRRADDGESAARHAAASGRAALERRAGSGDRETLETTARRLELDEREIAAVLGQDDDLVAAGRGLTRLREPV